MKQVFSDMDGLTAGFYDAHDSAAVADPVLMRQVHSAHVVVLSEKPAEPPVCDALVTRARGLTLTVKTADCAPILMADPQALVIAAVHAGWKGAFQGIIETTLLAMLREGARIERIRAAVGPHLQRDSFEVNAEMKSLFPVSESCFFTENKGKEWFDFGAYLMYRLNQAGVRQAEADGGDTLTSADYWSYRRQPENPARQYSCIRID